VKKALSFCLLLFFTGKFFPQADSGIKTIFVRHTNLFFNAQENHLGEDTVLDNHFNYVLPSFNGNIGLPSQEIYVEDKGLTEMGLRYVVPNYRKSFFTKSDVAFYSSRQPYTRAFALVGQRQEQIIRLIHTQNIRRFNYAVKFNRSKGLGFYTKQFSVEDNFHSTINYASKKDGYKVYGWFLFNKLRHEENGGIASDTAFEEGFTENKQLLAVNFRDGKRTMTKMDGGVTQLFGLNKRSDSAKTSRHFIYHSFNFTGEDYAFSQSPPDQAFFQNIYIDSAKTEDYAHLTKIMNSIGYNFQSGRNPGSGFFLEAKNESNWLSQYTIDTIIQNYSALAGASLQTETILAKMKAEYVGRGYNEGDYSLTADFTKNFAWKSSFIRLSGWNEKRRTDFFYNRYLGNNFQWANDFSPVNFTRLNAVVSVFRNAVQLEAYTKLISNYIYFDSLALPKAHSGSIAISRFSLSGNLKVKRIRFSAKFNYQMTNTPDVVRLPDYIAQSQLYYDGHLFKNNLHLQAGVQGTYYSSFYSNAYMPATNMFYLQNEKKYGDYPFVDVFINAEIKPVRFFFKLEHVNQGFSGPGFILTPDYPMPDRCFKFGFTWLFWD
jgi:hypothetical protein